jgi:small-conductance mechanosensitive channel
MAATTTQWIGAAVTLGLTIATLWVIRTVFFTPRARRLAEAVLRGEINPEIDTRLRVLERAIYALVLTIGIAIALSSFDGVRVIGRALLTSGVITAAIVGFAARQTLANVIAGLMIAITQPLRLGDYVGFEEHYGVVEDVTLSYTRLRTGNGTRVVIPNEKLAAGVLRNDSVIDAPVQPEVSVWIAPDADAARAVEVLREATGADVSVAEAVPQGVRLALGGPAVSPPDRAAREAELRAAALERLRAEGLLPRL